MNPFLIPVRPAPLAGRGSRPADEAELSVLSLPRGMQTFEMPRVPERVDPRALAAARELLARFLDTPAGLDLAGTAPAVLDIVNQVLGEGEVSIRARDAAADGGEWHIQETVFAGYWRCCRLYADGHIASDALVAAAIPPSVLEAARAGTATALAAIELPEGAMNAPALLAEIGAALPGAAAGGSRQVNLSLPGRAFDRSQPRNGSWTRPSGSSSAALARREPQRWRVPSRGFATPPAWPRAARSGA
jgi:hydrogenase-1 operon protein HyaF